MDVPNEIKKLLDSKDIKYKSFEHEPTPTSEIAAKVRGVSLETGAKAMILRSKGNFCMCVLRANNKIDFKKMKSILNTGSVSFATAEEVKKVTDCIPGGVPPFGNLFNIPVYADRNLFKNEIINFNAGLQTFSIQMKTEDWKNVVNPVVEDFAE
ncbi:MAG TPA: YbaK/EbsC family protein [Candidatus Nanoarchaeia archaeon]|nr:YbaK/EbsC family protein [Candidatus Nanoarchaeia archaeon]